MNVEDIASKISVIFGRPIWHDRKDQIFGFTLPKVVQRHYIARGGGITNQHLIACTLGNISAKNYQNWLMCVEVIACYISVVF